MKSTIILDIFNEKGASLGKKKFYTNHTNKSITEWITQYLYQDDCILGYTGNNGPDFQNNTYLYISVKQKINTNNTLNNATKYMITARNLIPMVVYFSVRHCIKATWINDRDQFLYPNNKWEKEIEFQNNCLAFMLFHGQNKITCKEGINHFIPFAELDINAQEALTSHFMQDFLQGRIKRGSPTKQVSKQNLFDDDTKFIPNKPLCFSQEAQEVLDSGKELFRHYHTQSSNDTSYNPNASLYDIKAYFQGFNDKGKMNPPQKAKDSVYKDLLGELNLALKELAKRIEPKVYEYGFLES
ncbi:hypothetical protein [Helicobacter himalayensis]|uniref:hypothetical protein n=1 Tax=Helicobacter himalayensis TaxID=1591088 RepID=UPI0008367381|nr:hypothetical protein [Helicobacter himalayensis]